MWIIQDAYFDKISELRNVLPEEVYKNFFLKFYDDPISKINIHNISNVYLLLGFKGSEDERIIEKDEKKFKDILSKEQNYQFELHGKVILGCLEIQKSEKSKKEGVHYIRWIESFVKGYNIGEIMIKKYENIKKDKHITLIPRAFISGSEDYWLKYFLKYIVNYYEDKEDNKVEDLISDLNYYYLNELKDELRWDNFIPKLIYQFCLDPSDYNSVFYKNSLY